MDKIRIVLERYLPSGTAGIITDWIVELRIHLHIKRGRRSKAGDYRSPVPGDQRHRISINHNLNPYAFLITLIHELAHRKVFQSGDRPHGEEWKREFKKLMQPFLSDRFFPADLLKVLIAYLENPAASSSSDEMLARVLRKYDNKRSGEMLLEELPAGGYFSLGDPRVFRKGELQRTRYLCECISNRKKYYVNAIAPVFPVEQP